MANNEPKNWITVNHKHIPLFDGETKNDAVKRFLESRSKEKAKANASKRGAEAVDKQQSDIAKAQAEAKKLQDEQKYRDSLKKGTKVTNKNGAMEFRGKTYRIGDYDGYTVEKPNGDYPLGDSMYNAVDKNGNLKSERAEVHRQVLEDYFTKIPKDGKDEPVTYKPYAPGEPKKALFTGGGGAAGKGQLSAITADSNGFQRFYGSDKQHLIIDADRLKYMLFKHDLANGVYDSALAKGAKEENLFNAGYYHNESSALADQIWQMSIDNNYPVMYDGTATKPKSVAKRLESCRKLGYSCHSNYIFADEPTVRENSIYRYCKGDDYGMHRLVPVDVLMGAHLKAQAAVPEIASLYDSFTLWDNTGRNMVKVASQNGREPLTVIDKGRWNTFQSNAHKDSFDYSLERIDEYQDEAERRRALWNKEHKNDKK